MKREWKISGNNTGKNIMGVMETVTRSIKGKSAIVWTRVKSSLEDESGIGVVEMILILVVLIGLVLIFKSQLTALVGDIFETITSESSSV